MFATKEESHEDVEDDEEEVYFEKIVLKDESPEEVGQQERKSPKVHL